MTVSKVTVVIPTRERPDTLAKSLKTALNQDWPNLEVIVSDNFSGPETAQVVNGIHDKRVKYFNTGRRVSMSHNFEFALGKATGDWLIVIGDDDGLLPNCIGRLVSLLNQRGVQGLASRTCYFNWPSKSAPNLSALSVPMRKKVEVCDAKSAVRGVLAGYIGYIDLPILYTGGMVSRDVVDRIRSIKGTLFQSQIPDVFSAFAICSVIDKFIRVHEPFAIAGSSKHSTGRNLLNLQPTAFLDEGNIPFHPEMALAEGETLTYSMPALNYESYLQSAYIHSDFVRANAARQLEIVLADTPVGHEQLIRWGKSFAARHGIDFDEIEARARKKWRALPRRLYVYGSLLENLACRYRIGHDSSKVPADVFEASLVAHDILTTRPSLLPSYASTIRRLAGSHA